MEDIFNKEKDHIQQQTVVKDNVLPKCILCREVPQLGIADGFILVGQFVCSKCEQQLLTLSYNDPTYKMMVQKLKEIIYSPKSKKQNFLQ
ncbi:MAG: sigma factor G inhibitor Gin [Peptococcaceae bacterium]